MKKVCNKCKKEKDLDLFGKHKKNKDGLNTSCKACDKIYQKQYQENHLDERIRDHKKWKTNNKEEIKTYLKEYNRNRYNNDPIFKQSNLLRVAFNDFVKKGIKSKSVMVLLDCSKEYFNNYIESQFLSGMTWSNHGTIWEYDHIQPISSFNPSLIEDHEVCWNYKNFMPRFKTSNIAKQFNSDQIGNKNKGAKYL